VTFALPVPGDGSAAVFVSPGGNDGSPGTQGSPVATIQRALAIVAASGDSCVPECGPDPSSCRRRFFAGAIHAYGHATLLQRLPPRFFP